MFIWVIYKKLLRNRTLIPIFVAWKIALPSVIVIVQLRPIRPNLSAWYALATHCAATHASGVILHDSSLNGPLCLFSICLSILALCVDIGIFVTLPSYLTSWRKVKCFTLWHSTCTSHKLCYFSLNNWAHFKILHKIS